MYVMYKHGHPEKKRASCICNKPGRRGDRLQLCYFVIVMVELGATIVQVGFAVTRVARLVRRIVGFGLHR